MRTIRTLLLAATAVMLFGSLAVPAHAKMHHHKHHHGHHQKH